MIALLVLGNKAVKPLLAAAHTRHPARGVRPKAIDVHYDALRPAMQGSSTSSPSPLDDRQIFVGFAPKCIKHRLIRSKKKPTFLPRAPWQRRWGTNKTIAL
jgi:hypothetical protein